MATSPSCPWTAVLPLLAAIAHIPLSCSTCSLSRSSLERNYSPILGLSNDLGSAYPAAPGYINARRWTPLLVVLYVMPQDSRE